jgi:hypothetical protein
VAVVRHHVECGLDARRCRGADDLGDYVIERHVVLITFNTRTRLVASADVALGTTTAPPKKGRGR